MHRDGKVKDANDCHWAALILQHGDESQHFELAHDFAKQAVALGDSTARWLFAATLDCWLLSTGKPQRFGTQFLQTTTGDWVLAPIDPTAATDAERAQYGVPPLATRYGCFKTRLTPRIVE